MPPVRTLCLALILALAAALSLTHMPAARGQTATPPLNPEQQVKYKEFERIGLRAQQLIVERKLDDAIEHLDKMLVILRDLFGENNPATAQAYGLLAQVHADRKDFAAVRAARSAIAKVQTALHGETDWRAAQARFELRDVDRLARWTPDDQAELDKAARLTKEAAALSAKLKHKEAQELYAQAAAIHERVLGKDHPDHATSLDKLAVSCDKGKTYTRAEPLHQQAIAIMKEALGDRHPRYAACLDHQGDHYRLRKKYAEARPLYEQALTIRRQALGSEHVDTVHSLNSLGVVCMQLKDYLAAEPCYREALDLGRKLYSSQSAGTKVIADNAKRLYKTVFDEEDKQPERRRQLGLEERDRLEDRTRQLERADKLTEAIASAEQMLAAERTLFGEPHKDIVGSLQWLTRLHLLRRDLAAARRVCAESVPMLDKVYPANHYRIRNGRAQMAVLEQLEKLDDAGRERFFRAQDQYQRFVNLSRAGKAKDALRLAEDTVVLYKETLGAEHTYAADALNWVWYLRGKTGASREAVQAALLEELAIRRKSQGDDHPRVGDVHYELGVRAENRGDYDEAIDHFLKAKRIFETTYGTKSRSFKDAIDRLDHRAIRADSNAKFAYRKGDLAATRKSRSQALTILTAIYGADDWEAIDARIALDEIDREMRFSAEERKSLEATAELQRRFDDLTRTKLADPKNLIGKKKDEPEEPKKDNRPEALAVGQQLLPLMESLWGAEHLGCGNLRLRIASLQRGLGQSEPADAAIAEVLAHRTKVLGEKHPNTVASLKSMASVHVRKNEYARAEELYTRAYRINGSLREKEDSNPFDVEKAITNTMLKSVGFLTGKNSFEGLFQRWDDTPEYFLGNIADKEVKAGNFERAVGLRRLSIPLTIEKFGPDHWKVVDARLALADVERLARMPAADRDRLAQATQLAGEASKLTYKKEHRKCLELAQQALAIRQELLGPGHRQCALLHDQIGNAHWSLGDYEQAEASLNQAVALNRKVLGNNHTETARLLHRLGGLYRTRRAYLRAERILNEARDIDAQRPWWEKTRFSEYAELTHELAIVRRNIGAFAKAEPLYLEHLKIYKDQKLKNENDENALQELAYFYLDWNRADKGLQHAQEAAAISRKNLETFATGGSFFAAFPGRSELDQLRMSEQARTFLDTYLSMAGAKGAEIEAAGYAELLAWKGSVSARQHTMRVLFRAAINSDSPAAKSFAALQDATRRLAALSTRETALGSGQGVDPSEWARMQQEMKTLTTQIQNIERDLAIKSGGFRAHLQQRDRKPEDLQRSLPADAVLFDFIKFNRYHPRSDGLGIGSLTPWMAAFVVRHDGPIVWVDLGPARQLEKIVDDWRRASWNPKAGALLKARVWDKLAPHIGDARLVLLSPDDFLVRVPWAALPGSKAGNFLIEEVALALIPIPRLLPELLDPIKSADQRSLLLVGGADFDGEPGKTEDKLALSRSADRARSGKGAWRYLPGTIKEVEAIEKIFRKQFPDAALTAFTGKDSTEDNIRAQASRARYLHFATHGYFAHPGGKKGPTDDRLMCGLVLAGANREARTGQDDGILTGLEVEALDLVNVDMAVLSACETMLGTTQGGGEGLMGLQRAFQVAGARSVVASLWQVPDKATMVLMERFYGNLLEKKMTRLEALREAQIWLLRTASRQPELLRGLEIVREDDDDQPSLPPRYWAAFVLSGNWK